MPQEYNLTSQEVDTGSTTNPLYTSHDDKKSDVQVDGVQMENQSTKEDDTKTDDKNEKKKDEPVKMAGVGEVFRFADCTDRLLMIVGSLGALCNGAALPLMIIVMGTMTDSFVMDERCADLIDSMMPDMMALTNLTEELIRDDPDMIGDLMDQLGKADEWEGCNTSILDEMKGYSIYYVALGGAVVVFGYFQVAFWQMSAIRQTQRIRVALFAAILRQEISWFDTHEAGELNTRMADDIQKIQDGIGEKLGIFLQWFSTFLAGFTIGFVYGWELTLVILAVSPLLIIAGAVMTMIGASMTTKELHAYAKAGAVAEEVLAAIRTVVAFGGQKKESDRYNVNLEEAQTFGIRKGLVNGLAMGFLYVVMFGAYALAFWYGTQLFLDGKYSPGDILIVFFCVLMGAFALGNGAPNLQNFATARGAAYAIFVIIDMEPAIDRTSTAGLKPEKVDGNIEFADVFFNYPSRPDTPILRGFTLDVNVGQTMALVGPSGCGKSTTVQLIQRFYDPAQGTVRLDGVDLRELNVAWLRQQIGVVNQEPVLFATTIKENIQYGRDGVTTTEIEAAAKEANAHNFIMQLPQQYDTLVGERGAQLSGGQKQRIAIARALVRNPKIILLDEATSALDTESEAIVQEALDKARMGRTTIVIAHRLSTVRNADVICGIDEGVVAETGSHAELMKQGGIYHTLVTNQTNIADEVFNEKINGSEKYQIQRTFSSGSETKIPGSPMKVKSISEEKEDENLPDPGMGRILKLNASEWPYITLGCICAAVTGIIQPLFAVIFAEILGVYAIPDHDELEKEANKYSVLFAIIGVVAGIAMTGQGYMFAKSGETLTTRLRDKTFYTLLGQDMAFFDDQKNSLGAMTTRLSTDASAVQGATGVRAGMMIASVTSLVTGLVIGFVYSWQLALVILAFAPFMVAAGFIQMKMMSGGANQDKEDMEAAGKVGVESIENIRTVATLCKEDHFYNVFVQYTEGPYKKNMKKANIQGLAYSFSQGIIFFAYAACFTMGAWLIERGDLTYTEMFKVFGAIVFSAMGVGNASSFAPDYGKAKVAASRLFALYDREVPIDSYSDEGEKLSIVEGSLDLSNVFFSYPTRPNIVVLKGVDLKVKTGQVVALVGSSGCGKSTIIQLLERFYDPHTGQVMLDGHDIRSLHIQWLRGQMGLVQQEPILFDCSIKNNIAYGDNSRDVSMQEIIDAAKQANIHTFVSSLPEGYDTNVGDKGAQLSGGQKQRVAIARALIRNPKILLLDEATSALDTESEKVVQEALEAAQKGRTSIVIAHRLSTIQNADCIVVLRNGIITEMGTHSSLLEQRGFYHKLHAVQAQAT